jgi:hypothetical protein
MANWNTPKINLPTNLKLKIWLKHYLIAAADRVIVNTYLL